MENGKTVGIKMYGIRPDTLLGVLGMENGDRLANDQRLRHGEPRKGARSVCATANRGQAHRPGEPPRSQNMNLDYNIK